MPKKKDKSSVEGLLAEIVRQPITQTLEKNYMPYAMSVIVSRAIPEIDGFKPSHRKLLYTMYKMGLLTGDRTKSANVVGQTMRLNPHGESAIYETMVRMTKGNEALLHPFVDSKGNFGKAYSRDMAYAASRYTEVKLSAICAEVFKDIDRDTIDFVDNYDNTTKEPKLLPTTFPNILVHANQGIAVGMASQICGFNLGEVCRTAIAILKNPEANIYDTLKAPDFSTGGELIYDEDAIKKIYETGRGSFKVRSRWQYDKSSNVIEITQIPYSTSAEAIIDSVAKLVKEGKVKEISDMRDETDLKGLKLTIDLKRGAEPEKLMRRLFKLTPLMDTFSCNFNILINGNPRVMGVREILDEWCAWRLTCVRRRICFDIERIKEKLHLLHGLQKILLDIDKAIAIIRQTEEESKVVPNLMVGFSIDEVQAGYVADIRLRNINREFILRRTAEIEQLQAELDNLELQVNSRARMVKIIIKELEQIEKKYAVPRKTLIIHDHEEYEEHIEDYPVHVFVSKEGYFKKIQPASLRMSGEQKYKDNDIPYQAYEASNTDEILFFTTHRQCYKAKLHEFDDCKASSLGDFLPSKLGMEDGESVLFTCLPGDYSGNMLFAFANGKIARVKLSAYTTLSNRRKLTNAYDGKAPIAAFYHLTSELDMLLESSDQRALIFNTASLSPKATRNTQGVSVISLKPRKTLISMFPASESKIVNHARYRARSLPSAGMILRSEDRGEIQLKLE